jgi:hypothetical protein
MSMVFDIYGLGCLWFGMHTVCDIYGFGCLWFGLFVFGFVKPIEIAMFMVYCAFDV